MALVVTSGGYERALVNGFVMAESVRERRSRDREDFHNRVIRHRGHDYFDRFDQKERSLDYDTLLRKSLSVNRHQKSAFRNDRIMELLDTGDFQTAPRRMQRLLLRDERINKFAREQRIEAWGHDVDEFDLTKRERRFDKEYCQLYNGRGQRIGDDMVFDTYVCMHEDDDLGYVQQRILWDACDRLALLINRREEDPSSRYNNLL